MSRPRKIVAPDEVPVHTAVRLPKWLHDQVNLIGSMQPDKKTFTDRLIYVLQQGIEKVIKDKEITTYDRIEAMVARTEDMVLTVLAQQLLSLPEGEEFTPTEVEEQKAIVEESIRKRRTNKTKPTEEGTK